MLSSQNTHTRTRSYYSQKLKREKNKNNQHIANKKKLKGKYKNPIFREYLLIPKVNDMFFFDALLVMYRFIYL